MNKAQSSLEYAVVIVCLVAALLAMQVYVKRSMQGRLRELGDQVGQQYAPKNTEGNTRVNYTSTTITTVETLSEQDLQAKYCRDPDDPYYPCQPCDGDLDGDCIIEDDVFGTETRSDIPEDNPSTPEDESSKTTRRGREDVGSLESSLFE